MHACIKFMNLSSQSSCKSLHRSCNSSFINYFSGYCQYKDCFKVSDTRYIKSIYAHHLASVVHSAGFTKPIGSIG